MKRPVDSMTNPGRFIVRPHRLMSCTRAGPAAMARALTNCPGAPIELGNFAHFPAAPGAAEHRMDAAIPARLRDIDTEGGRAGGVSRAASVLRPRCATCLRRRVAADGPIVLRDLVWVLQRLQYNPAMPETDPHSAHRRSRRWKRTAILALLLLAGGAVMNVAVAWPCTIALLGESPTDEESWARLLDSTWYRELVVRPEFSLGSVSMYRSAVSENVLVRGRIGHHEEDRRTAITRHRSGWPFLSLWGQREMRLLPGERYLFDQSTTVWALPYVSDGSFSENTAHILPLRPVFPGFLINTLFYALPLWLLFFAPFTARRTIRRRRGRCAKCAYPVGTSPVCTECGAVLRRR